MKIFTLLLSLSFMLFAGGDILPVEPMTKFEQMESDWVNKMDGYIPTETLVKGDGCLPTLEPAELLPYNGENIPDAQTESYTMKEIC
jgi:hypothetical protein